MKIELVKISVDDTEKLWEMQVQAFQKLLDKYQDFETNPANETLAQKVFCEIERIHGKDNWELDTIYQEKGNCRLYEKLGYIKTGEIDRINEKMDIVHYIKN